MKRSGRQKSSGRVVWDEANLNFLEVNKTPKRKITEPKTPYYAPDYENGSISPGSDGGTVNMDNPAHAKAIWNALTEVASTSSQHGSSRGEWNSEDDPYELDVDYHSAGLVQSGHRLSFVEQRKAHYDEYRKIRSLRQQGSMMNDGEEDDSCKQRGQDQQVLVDSMDCMEIEDETK